MTRTKQPTSRGTGMIAGPSRQTPSTDPQGLLGLLTVALAIVVLVYAVSNFRSTRPVGEDIFTQAQKVASGQTTP